MGVRHPALLSSEHVELVGERYTTATLDDVFGYDPAWRAVSPRRRAEIEALLGPATATVPPPGPESGPIPGDGSGGRHGTPESGMAGAAPSAGMALDGD
jgi:hypothetical protein